MKHHALIITGHDYPKAIKLIKKVHRISKNKAIDYVGSSKIVSSLTRSPINGYVSFFISTDGAEDGSYISEKGDSMRNNIIDFIDSFVKDGSLLIHYTEIYYGDDEGESKVERHN